MVKIKKKVVAKRVRQFNPNKNKGKIKCGQPLPTGGVCQTWVTDNSNSRNTHWRRYHHANAAENLAKIKLANQQSLSTKSITSFWTYREALKLPPPWDIEPETSDDDDEDLVRQEVKAVHENSKIPRVIETFSPFYASKLVAYYAGDSDLGVEATFEMQNGMVKSLLNPPFTFFLYYGTSDTIGPCPYFTDKKMSDTSKLTQLSLIPGFVVYTKDYVFSGGTTEQNRNKGFRWQIFWKTVGQNMRGSRAVLFRIGFEIVNGGGLQRKPGNKEELTDEELDRTIRIAKQKRNLLHDDDFLLPSGQNPDWVKYDVTEDVV